ncbi:ROK family glucokinase [Aquibacillus rhizosphaerae]|uniref:Glucokinase n=1 Tax=Aquibacillus rhizosphaerae TaxID=3051431 RepID=A0ABT7L849_9BACI|nr:ROK family glucokinase [Aquibacillus sp. LR5S19]MDL4841549.1 ROK family glucokinase [Aquibacillus sp. LR5S19]
MEEQIFIGVDIGGTTVKIAFISSKGAIIEKWEIPTRLENSGVHVPKDIWNSIDERIVRLKLNKQNIKGIGAGAPGFVDTPTGVVSVAVNIGWKDFELGAQLERLSNLPVYIDNDANIAAIGENWKGSGNKADNLIAITLGTGVGGGIISNGQIINGVNGTAGEIGHLTVDPEGAACNCGRRGCLETVASATGIVRQATESAQSNQHSLLRKILNANGELTSKDVFHAASQGDQESIEIIERVANVLGLAIANTATIINPSKVVIGGGVSKAGNDLLLPLKEAFNKYALPRVSDACELVIAELGNDAGVFGGAYLVIEGEK